MLTFVCLVVWGVTQRSGKENKFNSKCMCMDADKFVYAALELGSSHIRGLLAYKDASGRVVPMASRSVESSGCIVHGAIHNIDLVSSIAKEIIDAFNRELADSNYKIAQIYVSVNCRSLCSTRRIVTHTFEGDGTLVTEEDERLLKKEALEEALPRHELISVLPPYYIVNGRREVSIVGMLCREVRAYYTLLSIRESYYQLIKMLVENRLGLKLAGILATPICEAHVLLSSGVKQAGCALVNIGADCTTVSVYKNAALELLQVYPIGGAAITSDLTSLGILREDAERLKCTKLSALSELKDADIHVNVATLDGASMRKMSLTDLNRCIQARMKEILVNVQNLVECSGVANGLGAGYMFVGGTSLMKRFDRLLKDTGIKEYSLASSLNDKLFFAEHNTDKLFDNSAFYAGIVGAISMASQGCLEAVMFMPSPSVEEEEGNDPEDVIEATQSHSRGWIRGNRKSIPQDENPTPEPTKRGSRFSQFFNSMVSTAVGQKPDDVDYDDEQGE